MAKEYGSLTLEQQAKLMQEIGDIPTAEGDDKADELRYFIQSLDRHGFITPDKRVRYIQGIEDALARRRERYKEKKV
jgi:hypothetical protein